MSRGKRIKIDLNNINSLESLLQRVYDDTNTQIKEASNLIAEIKAHGNCEDVDDLTKTSKSKSDALKLKESAIKIRLDLAKLQNEVLKQQGFTRDGDETSKGSNEVDLRDFNTLREKLKKGNE